MADVMFHDHSNQPIAMPQAALVDQSDLDRMLAEAYAKGRADTFTFLGLDEKDFPQGDGVEAWLA